MAAVTIASGPTLNIQGNRRVVTAKLTAPADADTWVTGLYNIDVVQCTMTGSTIAAGDYAGVTSVSGGTVTFEIVGTARDVYVTVTGI